MGQQVKNLLRAQSKYGLIGSSAKTGEKFFEGHRSIFWSKMPFGIGHLPPPTHQMQSTCVQEGSRVPNLQTEFNYLNLFKSYGIFSDFMVLVVPTWSPSSPCQPHHPHVIPTSSLSSPCHPHSLQKVPMWSPWPVVLCGLRGLHMLSPWSLHHPRHPHIVPVIPMSSPSCPHCPHSLQKVPMWSSWLWSLWSPPHVVPVVPVIPTSSLSSPCHLEGPHIIHNPQTPTPPTHHPSWGWGPQISKNTIKFELIKIF